MPIDTSERDFEASIEAVLTGEAPPSGRTGEPRAAYGAFAAGGYAKRPPSAYDAASALLPDDVIEFILATQPETWQRLKRHVRGDVRASFLGRLRREVERRGTLSVLRRGLKDHGCHFKLCYFRPATTRNPDLQRTYRANLFSLVRQVPFSTRTNETVDLGLFLNGLPLFTAELKNPFKRQTARDAVRQYKKREASEPLFRFGRCLAHFAVGSEAVHMTTHLRGAKTRFLPFNQGSDGGKGNPPHPHGYRTSYLWEAVWSRDSVLDLVQHFIHTIDRLDDDGTPTGDTVLLFPRYHQLRAVRRLVQAARRDGPGGRYLVQHSAGSGKSISIATLAHQLAFLHDAEGRSVFDTVIVVTDRRVLDKQIAQVILQFERTRGVVADVKAGAKGLGRALAQGKRIVVVTLQTFPHVADAIRTSTGRRFAVIIDEAHSSQTGEYRKHLNDTLSARTLREAEGADAVEPDDLEDRIVAAIRTRGPQPNVSNFAFTATPKAKTLELFGEPQADGTFEAFDVYAMRQAIEEGFILDVLQHYTTRKDYFRLLKRVEDDPRYDRKQATRILRSFVGLHEHTVAKKVEIMAEHFATSVAHRIEGQAKALIVTRSRLHAVRYKQALDRYLRARDYPYQTLVAFSGTVEDGGMSFTEASMNGVPDTQTAKVFARRPYRFLVVANKYQTGFDQPLLHTMYVDKKLGGVGAVQTLSRLNRTCRGKEDTMVIDFANEAGEIEKAFAPYYERTRLVSATDPNTLHDLEYQLAAFGIYTRDDLDAFARLWYGDGGQQKDLHAVVDPCVDRYREAPPEEQADFRKRLFQFVRLYAFLAQVLPFDDTDLEKLYTFGRHLLAKLPIERQDVPSDLLQYVDLASIRMVETHKGEIKLTSGSDPLPPQKEGADEGERGEPQEDEPLSAILKLLNERFGFEATGEHRAFLARWESKVRERDAVRRSLQVNGLREARMTFDEVTREELQGMVDSNFEFYRKVVENEAFATVLFNFMFDRLRSEVTQP